MEETRRASPFPAPHAPSCWGVWPRLPGVWGGGPARPGSTVPWLRLPSSPLGAGAGSLEGDLVLRSEDLRQGVPGVGGGGYKNEERIPGQRKGAVSCNPIPLRSRTLGQQSAWAWDSVPAGSPQGPGSCQGFPDLHLTVSPRPPRWGTGSQLGAAAPTVPLVVCTCEPG